MVLASTIDFTLPLADPVLKFLLILLIILAAPLLLNKLRIPHLLGLIIAGAIINRTALISYYGIAALSCPGRRDCFISCFSPDWKSIWRTLREIVRKA